MKTEESLLYDGRCPDCIFARQRRELHASQIYVSEALRTANVRKNELFYAIEEGAASPSERAEFKRLELLVRALDLRERLVYTSINGGNSDKQFMGALALELASAEAKLGAHDAANARVTREGD
jgi:hypothetical protein